jgi:hypothetical protein
VGKDEVDVEKTPPVRDHVETKLTSRARTTERGVMCHIQEVQGLSERRRKGSEERRRESR